MAQTIMLVIYDCDGVLVDSEGIANQCLAEALGLPGEGLAEAVNGLRMREIISWAEARLGRTLPDDFEAGLQAKTYDRFRAELQAFPGVAQAVAALHAAGIATCVASSGAHEKLAVTLGVTGLMPLFEGRVFSGSEVARGKPFPDLFLHAASRMGVDPKHCLVVEDSEAGITAARAAGMRVVKFAPGGADSSDAVIVSHDQLIALINLP